VPPRYAYWTILIDDKPTAFRAREREELQPTFVQLQRKNTNVTMQWFARGRLWASREAERDDFQMHKHAAAAPRDRRDGRPSDSPEGAERRGSDWRPGGAHKDPRDRFKKKNRPERAWSEKDPATQRDRDKPGFAPPSDRPWQTKPTGPRSQRKPWSNKPSGDAPRGDRPWSNKPAAGGKRPWTGKPPDKSNVARPPSHGSGEPRRSSPDNRASGGGGFSPAGPRERKPWSDKPAGGAPRGDRPWSNKPPGSAPRGERPWQDKPRGKPQGDRPWSSRPPGGPPRGDRKPWQNKPSGGDRKPFRPRTGPPQNGPRKKRDDEPPDRG
jgi:23S rRNA pseudouridine2605 synthase